MTEWINQLLHKVFQMANTCKSCVSLFLFGVIWIELIQCQDASQSPFSPATFFALTGTEIHVPCFMGPFDAIWDQGPGGGDLLGRLRQFQEESDDKLLILAINDVKMTDAGRYTCSSIIGQSVTHIVVLEPGAPRNVHLLDVTPTKVTVVWSPPRPARRIQYYKIYLTPNQAKQQTAMFVIQRTSSRLNESFHLEDMIPGEKYEIKIAALYTSRDPDLGDVAEGPLSRSVTVTMPNIETDDLKVVKLKVEPWRNGTSRVSWQLNIAAAPKNLDGFKLFYTVQKKRKSVWREVFVDKPENGGRTWAVVFSHLKIRARYKVKVQPVFRRKAGQFSKIVSFKHWGFATELSITAVPLGPETVLVKFGIINGDLASKLRLFYSDYTATKWLRVNIINHKKQFTIVNGLQPRSTYYFAAKARVGKKYKQVFTTVTTPPTGLPQPTNLTVTPNDETSVEVSWSHHTSNMVTGYKVTVEEMGQDEAYRTFKEVAVPSEEMMVVINDMSLERQYRAKVTAFDLNGLGETSETILFKLGKHGEDKPMAPTFVDIQDSFYEMTEKDARHIVCSATGNPMPRISWSVNGRSLPDSSLIGSSTYTAAGITGDTVVTCEAENSEGRRYVTVYLKFVTTDNTTSTTPASTTSISETTKYTDRFLPQIRMYAVRTRGDNVELKWTVVRGDPSLVREYRYVLFQAVENAGNGPSSAHPQRLELIKGRIPSQSRSLVLHGLRLYDRLEAILHAVTEETDISSGVVAFVPIGLNNIYESELKTLHVNITEVRELNFRINVYVSGPKETTALSYRLKMVDKKSGRVLDNIQLSGNDSSMAITHNLFNRTFILKVYAYLDHGGNSYLSNELEVTTPPVGIEGQSVYSYSTNLTTGGTTPIVDDSSTLSTVTSTTTQTTPLPTSPVTRKLSFVFSNNGESP